MKKFGILGIFLILLSLEASATLASENVGGAPVLGNRLSNVTIVEVASYDIEEVSVAEDMLDALMTEYSGKIKFTFRAFPDDRGADASYIGDWLAAEAVECARDQGKYWEYRAAVLREKPAFDYDALYKAAYGKLDSLSKFQRCLNQRQKKDRLITETEELRKLKITKQPTFFINNERFDGLPKLTELKELIEAELGKVRCGNGEIDDFENCSSCPKDVACNAGEECREKKCVATVPIVEKDLCKDVKCDDGNACTIDKCNKENGKCMQENAADGTSCGLTKECAGGSCKKIEGPEKPESNIFQFNFGKISEKPPIASGIALVVGLIFLICSFLFRKGQLKVKVNEKPFFIRPKYFIILGLLAILAAIGLFFLT